MESPAQDPSEINALEASPDAAGGGSDSLESEDNGAPAVAPSGDNKKSDKPKSDGSGKKKGITDRFQGLLIHVNIIF